MKRTILRIFCASSIAIVLSVLLIHAQPQATVGKPKLLLTIVIDQFRYDYLLRFRSEYNSGLDRLLQRGAVFTEARYPQSMTVTAVGHSTFLSGAPPAASGIIGNEWYDRDLGRTITSVLDPATTLVGGVPGAVGSSPRRLLVSTIPDEIKMQGTPAKVIGVSIKDRSAILPLGHMADAAYWYDTDSNHWVTSSFYRADLPAWVTRLNDENTYRKYIGAAWRPYDSVGNAAPPFCTMVAGTETRYCGGIEATPWGNEMIEDFAERVIQGENLGHHPGTDVLSVSLSSNDYVGHAVGPDDPAVRDISIRTDRLLGKLFDYADQYVGPGNTLVVLTADHGVAPVPEVNQQRRMPGGRVEPFLSTAINAALTKHFGEGDWLMPGSILTPYLNLKLIESHKLDRAEVENVVAEAAMSVPHIARAYTRHDLLAGRVSQDTIGQAIALSFFAPRSADVYILQEPYYLTDATGTSHGTPYGYDTHVPMIFMGSGIKPGTYRENVAPNDIAPTLAAILGLETPSGSIGRVLYEIFAEPVKLSKP